MCQKDLDGADGGAGGGTSPRQSNPVGGGASTNI